MNLCRSGGVYGDLMAEDWDPAQFMYMQVADRIAARIESGELQPGARLQSEADLAEELGVARMTIRRAVEELRSRGLVRTLHGRGTFVIAAE
jgi:GntR family transcriptional regulator